MPRQKSFNTSDWFRKRIAYLTVFVQLIILVLLGRLWFIQIVSGHKFEKRAKENRLRLIPLKAPRGLIFARDKKLLVNNRPVYTVSIIPQGVQELPTVVKKLSRVLGLSEQEILAKIARQKKRRFQPVKLLPDVDLKIISLLAERKRDFPGVIIETEYQRNYLYNKLAAHVLGYVGEISETLLDTPEYRNFYQGDLLGQQGLEKTYDNYLQGLPGGAQVEVDAYGRERRTLYTRKPVPGYNLNLTLDLSLQQAAEEALGELIGAVIALNPNNGEILALVSHPAFDPNLFAGRISSGDWQALNDNPWRPLVNRAISNHYPPGSTFKVITATAGLEEKIISPADIFSCNGSFRLGRLVFKCWKERGHGSINLEEAIIHSCNVFFYNLGYRLGREKLIKYAYLYHFGERTNIDLTNEVSGLIPTPQWKRAVLNQSWYPGDSVQFAIGQGEVLVTPIQLANAYAALANGGTLYKPMIVKEVKTVSGQRIRLFQPKILGKIELGPKTLETIRLAMWKGVNRFGTGRRTYLKGRDICGKTGTAQVADVEYNEKNKEETAFKLRPHSWFVSFAPYKDPQIVLLVIVEHGGEGSSNAVPVARKVYEVFFEGQPIDTEMIESYRYPYMASWARPKTPAAGENPETTDADQLSTSDGNAEPIELQGQPRSGQDQPSAPGDKERNQP